MAGRRDARRCRRGGDYSLSSAASAMRLSGPTFEGQKLTTKVGLLRARDIAPQPKPPTIPADRQRAAAKLMATGDANRLRFAQRSLEKRSLTRELIFKSFKYVYSVH